MEKLEASESVRKQKEETTDQQPQPIVYGKDYIFIINFSNIIKIITDNPTLMITAGPGYTQPGFQPNPAMAGGMPQMPGMMPPAGMSVPQMGASTMPGGHFNLGGM